MKIRAMTRCALFSALLAVCAWLSIPLGDLAVSMQTFGVFLTLGVLGGRLGTAACGVYVGLGALGIPVFTGFQGGLGVLLGPTGGYIWGFLAAGAIFWALEKRIPLWLCMGLSLIGCYACGTAWYHFAYAQTGLWAVILKCVVPYLIPDGAKLALAVVVTRRLERLDRPRRR